jgi:hypothetical protein
LPLFYNISVRGLDDREQQGGPGLPVVFGLFVLLAIGYFSSALWGGLLLAPGDGMNLYYPKRLIARLIAGDSWLQLWNPYLYAGFPFMGSVESGAYYPPNWLALAVDPVAAFNTVVIAHYAFAGFGLYLYLRELGADGVSAFAGGAVFAYLGFMPAHLQHTTFLHAAPWTPFILFLIERERRRPSRETFGALALAMALFILAGHPQVLFNGMLVVAAALAWGVAAVGRGRRGRFLAATLGGLVVGTLVALPQLVATYDLARLSPREGMSYKYFTTFSFPPHMLPALVAPFLWGGGYGGRYWGPFTDTTAMEGYAGVMPLALAMAMVAVAARRDGRVRLWGTVLALAMLLSLGRYLPGYRLLYHIPLFNYFRASSRHWYEADIAIAVLFALGLAHVRGEGARRPVARAALLALAAMGAALLVASTVLRGPLMGAISSRLAPMRPEAGLRALSLSAPTIFVPLLLVMGGAAALYILSRWPRSRVAVAAVGVVLALDGASYKTGFGHGVSAGDVRGTCTTGAIGFLAKEAGPGETWRTAFLHERMPPLQGAMCGLRMIDGFEQLVDTRYMDLLGLDTRGVYADGAGLAENNTVLSMLSVRYLVVSPPMAPVIEDIRVPETPVAGYRERLYRKVYEGGGAIVYENPNALPRAWAVRRLIPLPGGLDNRAYLMGTPIDPSLAALVSEEDIPRGGAAFSPGAVEAVSDRPGRIEFSAKFPDGEGFLVLSEHYMKGWRAEIDGVSAEVVRVDGVLQGVRVPGGGHTVVFAYRPPWVLAALGIGAVALLGVSILIIRAGFGVRGPL